MLLSGRRGLHTVSSTPYSTSGGASVVMSETPTHSGQSVSPNPLQQRQEKGNSHRSIGQSCFHVARRAYTPWTPVGFDIILLLFLPINSSIQSKHIVHCHHHHHSTPLAPQTIPTPTPSPSRNPPPLTGRARLRHLRNMSSHAPVAYTPPRHRTGGVEWRRRARRPRMLASAPRKCSGKRSVARNSSK